MGDKGKRKIEDVLYFRSDISPFLVHLTCDSEATSAKEILREILSDKTLKARKPLISLASYGLGDGLSSLAEEDKMNFFGAICFTETPISEIHCFFEIKGRQRDFKPYGLVFLKHLLKSKQVSPVLYLNNEQGDQDHVVSFLCSSIDKDKEVAKKILPLISFFGKKLNSSDNQFPSGQMNFSWEREWRRPAALGDFKFNLEEDVFIGLCPDDEIDEFESEFPGLKFIDPMRNMKWYATKLIESREKFPEMKFSVV